MDADLSCGSEVVFKAIGEEDNRNRRWRQPYPVKVKLMGLDFVLAHQQHHYLATEAEKLDYFAGTLGLNRSYLPQRNYRSRHGRNITTRYFVDKFPLFLSGAPSAPSPVVGFCYVDGAIGKPKILPAAVQGPVQSARPFWDHLYGWG